MDTTQTGHRIRAARALGVPTKAELARRKRPQTGLTYVDVAERIGLDGYSAKTIGNMERGDTPALRPALEQIAQACGLPYAFFTIDFLTLAEPEETTRLEQRLTALEEFIRQDVVPVLAQAQPERPTVEPDAASARKPRGNAASGQTPEE